VSVVAIDTSARPRCVCVLATRDGELIRAEVTTGVALDVALPHALAALLDSRVEAVVVAVGPGSYTGLRSGIAAGLGVAHALDLTLHGVGSLTVIAAGHPAEAGARVWVGADAGRGGLWVAAAEGIDGSWRVAAPERVELARFDPGGLPVLSTDPLHLVGLREVRPEVALAHVVPIALQSVALPRAGLRAAYVE